MSKRFLRDILKDIRRNLNKQASESFDSSLRTVNAWIDDINDCNSNDKFSIEISSKYSKTGKPILISLYNYKRKNA